MRFEFEEFQRDIHRFVMPMTFDEYEKKKRQLLGKKKHLDTDTLCTSNNLSEKKCFAENCHYYFRNIPQLHHHLECYGKFVPARFHKLVKQNKNKEPEDIYKEIELFLEKDLDDKLVPENYHRTKDELIKYITMLKEKYLAMKK